MKLLLLSIGMFFAAPLFAQGHGEKEREEDILRHRAMAAAHEAAAKPRKDCLEKLRQDCKGLGIGKYCGLRHRH